MTQVLVDKHALDALLREMVDLREAYAIEGGALRQSQGEVMYLDPDDEVVVLAVQAGIVIPGPLAPGTVPPVPPAHHEGVCAPTFRADGGRQLRCVPCGKVVYTNIRGAEAACRLIAERQAMRPYLGACGHYHVSRVKK
jgi:hypothetical protein